MMINETHYDKFMREILDYITGTWLAKNPIVGCSLEQIKQAEEKIGKKLPSSLVAWYRHMGESPPDWNDHDADFSIRDLLAAQETARILTSLSDSHWKLTEQILPFSQRLEQDFLFVDIIMCDDPPVYLYVDGVPEVQSLGVAFSVFIRESIIQWFTPNGPLVLRPFGSDEYTLDQGVRQNGNLAEIPEGRPADAVWLD
jgi:hypothetical protein